MQEWQCVCPWIAPRTNLEGLLETLGEFTVPFLIVDNSPTSETKTMNLPKGIEVEYYPNNLGVAASWNRGLIRGAKWTLIVSASVRFGNGLQSFIDGASKRASAYGLNPRMAMHLYVIGKATVDEIGYPDENFYPIYEEDIDLWRRMILGGITGDGRSELPYYHPDDVTVVGDAMALKSGAIKFDMSENYAYTVRKWGMRAPHTEAAYKHPFNNPANPLSFWEKPSR